MINLIRFRLVEQQIKRETGKWKGEMEGRERTSDGSDYSSTNFGETDDGIFAADNYIAIEE